MIALSLIFLILCSRAVRGWSYDPSSPSPPNAWGRTHVGCSGLLAPWQSPMVLEPSDVSRASMIPTASCLITSVVNSSEPLHTVPILLKRMSSGLLIAKPSVKSKGSAIVQGITVRVELASKGGVRVTEEVNRESEKRTGLFLLEAVVIHTGGEHAAQVFGAVAELQFILNPLDASSNSGERTTVVSVPLILPSSVGTAPAAEHLTSPARSFVSQLLSEIRQMAATATESNSGSASLTAGGSKAASTLDESSQSSQAGTHGDTSVLQVAIGGLGGLTAPRRFFANTVPFLPVPVKVTPGKGHGYACHSQSTSTTCNAVEVQALPTVTYIYDGTLTFPPCLPYPTNSTLDAVPLSDFKRHYQSNSTVRFFPVSLGDFGTDSIRISLPTVRHIVTAPFQTSQQTIDSVVLLTGGRTTTVNEVSTAPSAVGSTVTKSVTTHYVPITTSRPAQRRAGRALATALTYLPVFQDVGKQHDYASSYRVGRPSTIELGVDGSSPIRVGGLMTASQGIREHHVLLRRRSSFNARLEQAIIILGFLCAAVLCYIVVLLFVRFDVIEIPTILGGKRLYVDFWTNPRTHIPCSNDNYDNSSPRGDSGAGYFGGHVSLKEPGLASKNLSSVMKSRAGHVTNQSRLAFDPNVTTMNKTPSSGAAVPTETSRGAYPSK